MYVRNFIKQLKMLKLSKNVPIYLRSNRDYSLIQIALIIKNIFQDRYNIDVPIYINNGSNI